MPRLKEKVTASALHTHGGSGKAAQLKRVFSVVASPSSSSPLVVASVVSSSPFLTRSDFNDFRKAGSLTKQSAFLFQMLCDTRFWPKARDPRNPFEITTASNMQGNPGAEQSRHFILFFNRSARNPFAHARRVCSTTAPPPPPRPLSVRFSGTSRLERLPMLLAFLPR